MSFNCPCKLDLFSELKYVWSNILFNTLFLDAKLRDLDWVLEIHIFNYQFPMLFLRFVVLVLSSLKTPSLFTPTLHFAQPGNELPSPIVLLGVSSKQFLKIKCFFYWLFKLKHHQGRFCFTSKVSIV